MSLSYFSALFFQVTVKSLNFWDVEQNVLGKSCLGNVVR